MHFHIVWGPIVSSKPSVLDFTDKQEALDKFIEIGKAIELAENFKDLPGTATKFELDSETLVIKLETNQTRICFLYCGHKDCESRKKANESMLN